MNLLVGFLIFVAIGVTAKAADIRPPPDHADGPLKTYTPEAIVGAVKLRDALTGTVWSYHYRDGKYEVGFGRAGDIQLLKSWKAVSWRIAGPREVILESTRGEYMILRFDNSLQHFWTKDWDGQKATGRQTDQRMPGEAPASPKKRLRHESEARSALCRSAP